MKKNSIINDRDLYLEKNKKLEQENELIEKLKLENVNLNNIIKEKEELLKETQNSLLNKDNNIKQLNEMLEEFKKNDTKQKFSDLSEQLNSIKNEYRCRLCPILKNI